MNTNQVDCFLESAERLSFSAAAVALYLSPQAVSKQVISLEKELDVRLFERNGPKLSLTPMGAMYQRLFEGHVRKYSFLREDMRLHRKSLTMSLRIGVSEWLDPFGDFGGGLRSYFAERPKTNFSLRHCTNSELLEALLKGEADCGFFSGAQQPDRRDLECVTVATEDILLFAPSDLGEGPAREDCWGLPMFMTLAWNWSRAEYKLLGFRERLMAGLEPPELITLPNYQSLASEMRLNRGVTLAGDRFTPFARIPTLTGHPLGLRDEVVCLWRRDNENPLLPELASHLQAYFGQ